MCYTYQVLVVRTLRQLAIVLVQHVLAVGRVPRLDIVHVRTKHSGCKVSKKKKKSIQTSRDQHKQANPAPQVGRLWRVSGEDVLAACSKACWRASVKAFAASGLGWNDELKRRSVGCAARRAAERGITARKAAIVQEDCKERSYGWADPRAGAAGTRVSRETVVRPLDAQGPQPFRRHARTRSARRCAVATDMATYAYE